jgi:hypothetical protein
LIIADRKYFLWYTAGDVGLYFLQKILRGDFHYWFPIEGGTGILISFLMRLTTKLVTDYTGIIHFRASPEMGGAYWSFNLLLALVAPLAVIKICYDKAALDAIAMEEKMAWRVVGWLGLAWVFFFGLFLMLIKSEFRRTFYSLERGTEWAMSFFLNGPTDLAKTKTLGCNRKMWKPIEDEVKVWIFDGWEGWEEEKPGWFTEVFKASLDDDWLSAAELRRQKVEGGGQRRRSSLGQVMAVGSSARSGSGRRSSGSVLPEAQLVDGEGVLPNL